MDVKEQLAALGLHKGTGGLAPRPAVPPRRGPSIEEVVDGEIVPGDAGDCFVVRTEHDASHPHGALQLDALWQVTPATLARLARDDALAQVDLTRLLFVDIETTGLAGGTGTYAFLIGLGYFQSADSFVTEQLFMRDFDEELAQLSLLSHTLSAFGAVVSFNGKAFDLPIIQTRLALARLPFELRGAPHLDLLSPARRLWSHDLPSCALSSLEYNVLGVERRGEDVPGYLIPAIYFDYVQTGDAGPLAGVFYHNEQDILSMVTLAARVSRAIENPGEAGITSLEMVGVARLYEEWGWTERSTQTYVDALQRALPASQQELALRRLSFLYKRVGRRAEAAELWHRQLDDEGTAPLYPYVELAKYYEWGVGDVDRAAELTERAGRLVARWPRGPDRRRAQDELAHRLQRLQRKRSDQPPAAGDTTPEE